jgi:NAD(P)-dependent dehydrogenase (short-subunit alcohol dehydrogenase family)
MPNISSIANPSRKVALITGASYGVGAAIAKALVRDGLDVALTATRSQNLAAVLAEITAAGGRAIPIDLELRSQKIIESAVAKVIGKFGRIDVLVNNAGAFLRRKAVDVTREEWDDMIATNLTGSFFLTQQVGRHLIARGAAGSIITVSSTHGLVGAIERSTYGITKGALIQMTRMLAIEWADHGIRVNAVAPGRLDTPSQSRGGTDSDTGYMEAMLKRIPLHRLATAEEIAAVVVFLASASAASITGQTIVVDGGLTAA